MMKRAIQIVILSVMSLCYASEIQLIHSAPYRPVNVDFNGSELIYNFNYMSATAPIGVSGSGTISVNSINGNYAHSFALDIEANKKYAVGITGTLENQNEPLKIAITSLSGGSDVSNSFQIKLFNGISDIGGLDFYASEQLIVQNVGYGEFSEYFDISTQTDEIVVKESGTNNNIGSYGVEIAQRTGQSGIVYASGYYNSEQPFAPFSMSMVYSNGLVDRLENAVSTLDETASVQIIHNSPYPVVDIYVDGTEALGDVPYRATTGLIDLPISTTVGIAPANDAIIASFPFSLVSGGHYVVTASGIVGDTDHPFDLVASTLDTAAVDADHFALKVYHGVTDAPAVDIYANGSLLVDSLDYGDYAGYVQVPVGDYTIDIAAHGSTTPVASFSAPLTGLGGGAGVVFASGFLSPAATDSAFTLILTTPSGYDVELPAADPILGQTASVQIIHNSPYPVVDIYVDGTEALGDVPYRATTGLIDLPISTTVGIAPANDAIIASFPFSLVSGGHYVVTASGIVGDTDHPFDLVASTLDTAAVDADHFALKVYHGVTDAPAVDIYANGSLLVDSLDYGDYAGYVQVPVGDYTIDIAAHGSTTPVASFSAPLTGLGGGAGVVFASGFLSPARTDSAFTLILTTPSGYSVELPATTTALATDDEIGISPLTFELNQNYPNPFNPTTTIGFQLSNPGNVVIKIFDINGRLVKAFNQTGLNSGSHSVIWNGTNQAGQYVAGGLYLYSLSSGDNSSAIRKMTLVK